MNRLIDLAERCEKAAGPDIELDRAIFNASGIVPDRAHGLVYPHYAFTESIDAAMTLVPEGWGFKAEHNLGWPSQFTVGHVGPNKFYDQPEGWAQAATPALALCAAALRAKVGADGR